MIFALICCLFSFILLVNHFFIIRLLGFVAVCFTCYISYVFGGVWMAIFAPAITMTIASVVFERKGENASKAASAAELQKEPDDSHVTQRNQWK